MNISRLTLVLWLVLGVGCRTPPDPCGFTVNETGCWNSARQPNRAPFIKVATFNIRTFGKAKATNRGVMTTLVAVIRRYDIIAVQEIKDATQSAPAKLLNAINARHVHHYAFALSPRTGRQADDLKSQEQYGYLFNRETVTQLGKGMLFDDNANDFFQREPFIARFKAGQFTFVLINIHTRPKHAVAEIDALEHVFAWARQQYPNEDDFIALGDFNAGCGYASPKALDALPISGPGYKWIVPHNADTNLGASQCAYDRIVITTNVLAHWTGRWGVNRAFNDGRVSDHWPVWASFWTSQSR